MLHRNLAFPLLKVLVDVGDPLAKKVFKDEIVIRFESGYPSVVLYLIKEGYLDYLNEEELNTLFESSKFLENLPKWFFEKLREKIIDLDCPYCGTKLKESISERICRGEYIRCEYCYTSFTRIT